MTGKDGERHSIETDAISLFDAAYKTRQQWAVFWWFSSDALIEVRAGDHSWHVRQDRLRVWATGVCESAGGSEVEKLSFCTSSWVGTE